MTTLDDSIRRTIDAYLARTNTSARRFGQLALRDPGFVSSLKTGRSLRLDTADRLLEFMNEAPIGPTFRSDVEAFLSRTGMQPYKLGSDAVGDSSFVTRLRSGASPRLRTVERVRKWIGSTRLGPSPLPFAEGRPRGRMASSWHHPEKFLSTRQVAALLTISPRSLHRYREDGGGPPYLRLGHRIMYPTDDLLDWAWSKRERPDP